MSNLELFKIWAPEERVWSQWAKPILFAQNAVLMEHLQHLSPWPSLDLPNDHGTALVIDLPREKSVDYGIAAARIGRSMDRESSHAARRLLFGRDDPVGPCVLGH